MTHIEAQDNLSLSGRYFMFLY